MGRIKRLISEFELKDISCFFKLMLSLIPAILVKAKHKNIWLIAERPNVADDNGWMFFKWIRKNYPDDKCYFILSKEAHNFKSDDKHMIAWESWKHYVYYIASHCHINAMFTSCTPNIKVCKHFNSVFNRNLKTYYIRHGIHKDGVEMYKYEYHKYRILFCGAKPEYDYFKANAGYPEGHLKYTGFARFDDLLERKRDDRFILIIPTWRRYIGFDTNKTEKENEQVFLNSDFYRYYTKLLTNPDLLGFLEANDIKARFCLHAQYRKFEKFFESDNPYIEMVSKEESIHELLLSTSLLITDYSSVFFDAAYADKACIFYHFDYEEFRSKHFSEGYFCYERDGFGPVVKYEKELVEEMTKMFDGNTFVMPQEYAERCEVFFPLHDTNNCRRIYESIKETL